MTQITYLNNIMEALSEYTINVRNSLVTLQQQNKQKSLSSKNQEMSSPLISTVNSSRVSSQLYGIEVLTPQGQTKKFKWKLLCEKISEIKQQIKEKLIDKKIINQSEQITIHDIEGFQLQDDGIISQFIKDNKIKIQTNQQQSLYSSSSKSSKSNKTIKSRRSHKSHRSYKSAKPDFSMSDLDVSNVLESFSIQNFQDLQKSKKQKQLLNQKQQKQKKQKDKSDQSNNTNGDKNKDDYEFIMNNLQKGYSKNLGRMQTEYQKNVYSKTAIEQITPFNNSMKFEQMNNQDKFLIAIFPQISNKQIPILLPKQRFLNYLEFSNFIVKKLDIQKKLIALLYTEDGLPYIFNLDFILFEFPRLNYNKKYVIIITNTFPTWQQQIPFIQKQIYKQLSIVTVIKILKLQPLNVQIQIDLNNKVSVLKYKIYQKTKIHPQNQILQYKGKVLQKNDILKEKQINSTSIIQLKFKSNNCNNYNSQLSDIMYYNDVTLINPQTQTSLLTFKCHIMVLIKHLQETQFYKFLMVLQIYSRNSGLIYALKTLKQNGFLTQTNKIALQEGIYDCIVKMLKSFNPKKQLNIEKNTVFTYTRHFFSYILSQMQQITFSQTQKDYLNHYNKCMKMKSQCSITYEVIINPRILTTDNLELVLVDKKSMQQMISKKYTFLNYQNPNIQDIGESEKLNSDWRIFLQNRIDNDILPILHCIGRKETSSMINCLPKPSQYTLDDLLQKMLKHKKFQIYTPLQAKKNYNAYFMIKIKSLLCIFIERTKDVQKPCQIFYPITGKIDNVNLDLIASSIDSQNVELSSKVKKQSVMTRVPKQAIVILIDVSESMGWQFFDQKDLTRIGAIKSFFEAFAYRTIAYNFQHVISLIFFNKQIETKCEFTQSIFDFNKLVSDAKPSGRTRLYDSIKLAIEKLMILKQKNTQCKLRIVALTDGQDNESQAKPEQLIQLLRQQKITIDSFSVGQQSKGLKNITFAVGGKCYLMNNFSKCNKLFQQETLLSVRARNSIQVPQGSIQEILKSVKNKKYDNVDDYQEFNHPQVKATSQSWQQFFKKLQDYETMKKFQSISCLKRIIADFKKYSYDPHTSVSIYPTQDITIWKILLFGPKDTPYQNGLFQLYVRFPAQYPTHPPEIRFITPIYHCNINEQGRICHAILDRNYSPFLSFRNIIDQIYGLLLSPQPNDPLDASIGSLYISDFSLYLKNAEEKTKQSAIRNIENLAQQLYGKIEDDLKRRKRTKQIQNWYNEALLKGGMFDF